MGTLGWAVAAFFALTGVVFLLILGRWIAGFLRDAFGTADVSKIARETREAEAIRPKSISSMTRLLLPAVQEDFPAFSWQVMQARCRQAVAAFLEARVSGSLMALEAFPGELRRCAEQLNTQDALAGERLFCRDIRMHDTALIGYTREADRAVLTVAVSVGFLEWRERAGKLLSGDRELPRQTRFRLEAAYVRDASAAGEATGLGLTCPHCGAPVTNLGDKVCAYCGSAVIPLQDKVWYFTDISEY